MPRKPEVCILPVAGLSTRNLPATKALHKGFLTLDSRPIIQYAVDACTEIGIKEIFLFHYFLSIIIILKFFKNIN